MNELREMDFQTVIPITRKNKQSLEIYIYMVASLFTKSGIEIEEKKFNPIGRFGHV